MRLGDGLIFCNKSNLVNFCGRKNLKLSKVSSFFRIICKKTVSQYINLFLIAVILKSSNLKVFIYMKQVENSPKRFGRHGNCEQMFELYKNIVLIEKIKDFIITTKVNTIQNTFCMKKLHRIYK